MDDERTCRNYLRDLVYGLRELGSKAARSSRASGRHLMKDES